MGKSRKTTVSTTTNAEDILKGIQRMKPSGVGDSYLTVNDFYESPNLTNEDYYPSKNRDINVGSASYKSLGSQPIFVGYGNEAPMAVAAKRQKAFEQAALKAKMYNMAVDEKKKAAEQGLGNLAATDKEVPMQYNMDYQTEGLNIVDQYKKKAMSDPSFQSPADALNDLASSTGKYGAQMQRDLIAHKVYGENLNQAAQVSNDIERNIAEGNFVPDGVREANRRFNAGEMKGQDANKIMFDMTAMTAMKNLLPELNSFSSNFDATKTAGGYHYVSEKNVESSARGFVKEKIDGGQGIALAASLGLPPNATLDQMTTALTKQVVQRHATQQDKVADEQTAADKNREWKKEGNTLYNGQNVWQYNVDKDGKETFTFAKVNPTDNSAMTFTLGGGKSIKGVSGRIEKYPGERQQHIFVSTPNEYGELTEVEVPADAANVDKIKAEYGKNIFEVRNAVTGGFDVKPGTTGTVKETTVKSTSSSSGKSGTEKIYTREEIKAMGNPPYTDEEVDQIIKSGKAKVK